MLFCRCSGIAINDVIRAVTRPLAQYHASRRDRAGCVTATPACRHLLRALCAHPASRPVQTECRTNALRVGVPCRSNVCG